MDLGVEKRAAPAKQKILIQCLRDPQKGTEQGSEIMDCATHRPQGYRGKGDSHLPKIVRRLRQVLSETQNDFAYDTLRLPADAMGELAGILVDFAEDLHNDIGIWESYERYNTEFFGRALPLTSTENGGDSTTGFRPDRFLHLLWVLYPAFIDGLVLSPTHQDLQRIANASSTFLSDAFASVPKDSGVKALLRSSNAYGWEVKGKLIWLGCHSFMFRIWFARYMEEQDAEWSDIGHTDDFLCQECTRWSGLGAIDILAGALDISGDDLQALRSWYERHAAFYQILSVSKDTLEAVNVINDQPYRIRISLKRNPFKPGQLIFGSLVPWRGEWYWSGEQRNVGDASKVDVDELKATMKRQSPSIVCRYSKEYETEVRERMSKLHEQMIAYHGKDLVVYPDGLSMAADWQKELRWQWESRPQEEVQKVIKRHGLKKNRPEINLPKELLDEKNGLGVFLNPDEGKEIMTHFTSLVKALKKKGEGLAGEEEEVIRGFFDSEAVSPRFVRRMLEEYGDESVKAAFLLKGDLPGYWLDYLFRSHKGQFYRKRYPCLSVV
jgi:hypothetical protein